MCGTAAGDRRSSAVRSRARYNFWGPIGRRDPSVAAPELLHYRLLALVDDQAAALAADQRGVVAVLTHQLRMGAALGDASLFEDDHAIGVNNGCEPMGDDERRSPLHQD